VWAGVEKNSLSPPGFEPSSPLRVTVSTSVALDSMVFHSRCVKGKYHLRVRQPRSSATIITHNPSALSVVRQTARNLTSLTRATSYVTRHTSTVSVGPRISKHMYNFRLRVALRITRHHDTYVLRAPCSERPRLSKENSTMKCQRGRTFITF
jgi:hypothetical protein